MLRVTGGSEIFMRGAAFDLPPTQTALVTPKAKAKQSECIETFQN